MGGEVESPQGIKTPGVEDSPQGDETSRVPTKGERVPGEDRRGRGGNGTSPTTQENEACGASGGNEGMTREPGTAADKDSVGTLPAQAF